MPVPKRKSSKSRKNKRSANKYINVQAFTACSNCQTAIAPHQACGDCGFYKGAKVLRTRGERAVKRGEAKLAKAAKKAAPAGEPAQVTAQTEEEPKK